MTIGIHKALGIYAYNQTRSAGTYVKQGWGASTTKIGQRVDNELTGHALKPILVKKDRKVWHKYTRKIVTWLEKNKYKIINSQLSVAYKDIVRSKIDLLCLHKPTKKVTIMEIKTGSQYGVTYAGGTKKLRMAPPFEKVADTPRNRHLMQVYCYQYMRLLHEPMKCQDEKAIVLIVNNKAKIAHVLDKKPKWLTNDKMQTLFKQIEKGEAHSRT